MQFAVIHKIFLRFFDQARRKIAEILRVLRESKSEGRRAPANGRLREQDAKRSVLCPGRRDERVQSERDSTAAQSGGKDGVKTCEGINSEFP